MLYSEFIQGTGCKETDYNYQVYKNLEELYMANDKLTKEDIYQVGKKLVDNSKSESEIEFEERLQNEVNKVKEDIEMYNKEIEMYQGFIDYFTEENESHKYWKEQIQWRRNNISYLRGKLKEYKYFFKIS